MDAENGNEPLLSPLDPLGLQSLLAEVVERVEGVVNLADRLQELLQAVISIGSQLELDRVLSEIVTTATQLSGARYGAIGVLGIADEWRLSQFITVGIEEEARLEIGELPRGRGILGLLIDEPRPIRLHDISEHMASYGFPPNHPPMKSFLGTPILVKGEVFGNIYLTEKIGGGDFTEIDEQITMALATAAGLAVQNARLFEQSQQRRKWLETIGDITTRLLGGEDLSQVFQRLVLGARDLAGADAVFLVLPNTEGELRVEYGAGAHSETVIGMHVPAHSLSAQVMATGTPIAIADSQADGRVWKELMVATSAGPAIFVPIGSLEHSVGTLVVTNQSGGDRFSEETTQVLGALADQAAIALRLGSAAQDREQVAILEDRGRIGRDLHDLVIQRLFGTAMGLQSAITSMPDSPGVQRVRQEVENIDDTIKEIRSTIFALHTPAPNSGEGLRSVVLQATSTAATVLGFIPRVRFDGPVDTVTPPHIAEHLLAVLRESLSNTARHAHGSEVIVTITTRGDQVTLEVLDDGVGLPIEGRRSGLNNLAKRARNLQGTFSANPRPTPQRGTQILWSVPIPKSPVDHRTTAQ